MSDSSAPPSRIARSREKAMTYHGPVQQEVDDSGAIHSIVFTGGEESDVLHAAADWMADHLYASIVGLTWYDGSTPEQDPPAPTNKLRLLVDMSNYLPAQRSPANPRGDSREQ